jgi:hypothetical protein
MLKTLVGHFEAVTTLPIEVEEIAHKIKELEYQDEIHLFPADCDQTVLRGVYTQFRYHAAVYGDARWVTHIAYCKSVPLEWQRVICAKELVHIFDSPAAMTDTADEVNGLLDKLVGPLSTEDYGFADIMATKDRLALYQCLPLLLPKASLDIAREEVRAGRKTAQEVADWACMPVRLVELMLSEDWTRLNGALEDF